MIRFLILYIITLPFLSCRADESENCHGSINVSNETSKTIYVIYSGGYPDTTAFKLRTNPSLDAYNTKVESGQTSSEVIKADGGCVEKFFEPWRALSEGILMVYVFDGEIIETVSWDTIKKNNQYLKRYDLTLDQIKELSFEIKYNGQ